MPVYRLLAILTAATLGLGLTSEAGARTKILHGQPAGMDSMPFVVALQGRFSSLGGWDQSAQPSTFCSGSLIAPRWILTAAHCMSWIDPVTRSSGQLDKYLQVHFGNLQEPLDIGIDRYLIHPGYKEGWTDPISGQPVAGSPAISSLDNGTDAALVHLQDDAAVETLPFAHNRRQDQAGREAAQIAGYGIYDQSGNMAEQLITGGESLSSDRMCARQSVSYLFGPYANARYQLCRRPEPLGQPTDKPITCNGDSGGPIMTRPGGQWMLVGMTSWGTSVDGSCDGGEAIDVYTRVAGLWGWIKHIIGPSSTKGIYGANLHRLQLLPRGGLAMDFGAPESKGRLRVQASRFLPRPWNGLSWMPQIGLGQDIRFAYAADSKSGQIRMRTAAGWAVWKPGECLVLAWQWIGDDDTYSSLRQRSWKIYTQGRRKWLRPASCGLRIK